MTSKSQQKRINVQRGGKPMTDEEYIRAGVELADGWRFNTPEERERHDTSYWRQELVRIPSFGHYALPLSQQAVDALAAQLVRQVEVLPEPIRVLADKSCEVGAGGSFTVVGTRYSNDRSMNTIKAIVDSGVLISEGETMQTGRGKPGHSTAQGEQPK